MVVFCLLALLSSKVFPCWSSGGEYGCWCWLLISFAEYFISKFVYSLCIFVVMKLEIRFVIQLGIICNCDFVGVERVSADQNGGLVRYMMVVAKTICITLTNGV